MARNCRSAVTAYFRHSANTGIHMQGIRHFESGSMIPASEAQTPPATII